MNRKLRALQRLRWLRERQRDKAAQSRGDAQRSLSSAEKGHAEAKDFYADAAAILVHKITAARRIADIELLRQDVADCGQAVLSAQHIAALARLQLDARATDLATTERALKTSEKLLGRASSEADRARERRAQRDSDDLTGARRRNPDE